MGLGRYESRVAAATTRARVRSLTGWSLSGSRARDAVVNETSAWRATSDRMGRRRIVAGDRPLADLTGTGGLCLDTGSFTQTEMEMDFRDCPILWPWPSRVNHSLCGRHASVPAIHHLGWAVRSIDAAREHFETALGLEFRGEESHPDVRVAFFGAGLVTVELLEPLGDKTDVGMFIASRGEGIHHLALKVDDVAAALADAPRNGFVPVDGAPHRGSRGTVVGMVDPRRPDGVLIQYVQEP